MNKFKYFLVLSVVVQSQFNFYSQVIGEPVQIYQNICGSSMIETQLDCDDNIDFIFSGYRCQEWFEYIWRCLSVVCFIC